MWTAHMDAQFMLDVHASWVYNIFWVFTEKILLIYPPEFNCWDILHWICHLLSKKPQRAKRESSFSDGKVLHRFSCQISPSCFCFPSFGLFVHQVPDEHLSVFDMRLTFLLWTRSCYLSNSGFCDSPPEQMPPFSHRIICQFVFCFTCLGWCLRWCSGWPRAVPQPIWRSGPATLRPPVLRCTSTGWAIRRCLVRVRVRVRHSGMVAAKLKRSCS